MSLQVVLQGTGSLAAFVRAIKPFLAAEIPVLRCLRLVNGLRVLADIALVGAAISTPAAVDGSFMRAHMLLVAVPGAATILGPALLAFFLPLLLLLIP